MRINDTKREVLKRIANFSLPYLLSVFMQTLYGMADLFIIGQFNGVESTTAVSIGSQVMHMFTVIIVGMAMGSTVLIGKAAGERNKEAISSVIGNSTILFSVLSVIGMVVLLNAVKPIVSIMSTPSEAVSGTVVYLVICFIGIPFITAYNVISSIFRGKGDSKTPMYFVAVACVSNIALDYLFIGAFHMGTAGAALGTTLSQAISVVVSLVSVTKRDMGISVRRESFCLKKTIMRDLFKIGIPVALQDGFIQISFLAITMFANMRGLEDAAAVGIVEKIISILFLVPSAMLSTVSALSAQYIGAREDRLARLTLKYAACISVTFGIISVAIMQGAAESVIGCFSRNDNVILMGGQYMRGYVWDCLLAGVHFCFSGYFCARGMSGISFAHNCISILTARIPISYFASRHFPNTLFPMGLASTIGSCISIVVCVAAYVYIRKRVDKA